MLAVGSLCKEEKTAAKDDYRRLLDRCSRKYCNVQHSREVIVIALISLLYLKDKLSLCSMNCYIYAMTGNCSASLRALADYLRVVSAMTGNPPLGATSILKFSCKMSI